MNNNIKKMKFGIFILLIFFGVFIVYINRDFLYNFNIDDVTESIKERKLILVTLYLGIYIIKPLLLIIPSNVVALTGGILFGPINAFILTMSGFTISGTIAFYLARLLGRDFVEHILKKRFNKLERIMKESGFKYLFILRLPPVIPYDPLSYICGLTNISYKDFILASLLGVIPETICYSIIGTNIKNPLSAQFIVPILFLIIATVAAKYVIDRGKKYKK